MLGLVQTHQAWPCCAGVCRATLCWGLLSTQTTCAYRYSTNSAALMGHSAALHCQPPPHPVPASPVSLPTARVEHQDVRESSLPSHKEVCRRPHPPLCGAAERSMPGAAACVAACGAAALVVGAHRGLLPATSQGRWGWWHPGCLCNRQDNSKVIVDCDAGAAATSVTPSLGLRTAWQC
jgi:hypothetical protein